MSSSSLLPILLNEEINHADHQYYLRRIIGEGGYGAVFEADQVINDKFKKKVAIKLIAPTDETRDLTLKELQMATQLVESKYLLPCYTSGQWFYNKLSTGSVEYLYLVMELAESTLRDRLKQGALPLEDVRFLVQCITEALVALHQQVPRQIHGDLKPENVLLLRDTWKLADFGLTRSIDLSKSALYTTTFAKGTPIYAPPEAYQGRTGSEGDLWALGIILMEALIGKSPFARDSAQQIQTAVVEEPPQGVDDLPAAFKAIAEGCLQKNHRERWTAVQVQAALLAMPENLPSNIPIPPTLPSPKLPSPIHPSEFSKNHGVMFTFDEDPFGAFNHKKSQFNQG